LAGGEDGAAEGEAIDIALNTKLAALAPEFSGVKGQADNDPAKVALHALQHGLKVFYRRFGRRHER
jgi:hypothetical protein